MEFFITLEKILQIKEPSVKCSSFKTFYEKYLKSEFEFNHEHKSLEFEEPSYLPFCKLESKDFVVKRKKLSVDKGKAIFLHAISHIEYSAIDLALDAAYRFKNMPQKFYDDWLEVASDEVRHFIMLEELLKDVDSYYGQYPVHNGLFRASVNTKLLYERMAVVPRYLEANGLDATPVMVEKLEKIQDDIKAQNMIKVLEVILEEEIEHVLKGDFWFKYACDEKNLDYDIYFEIIEKHYPSPFPRKKDINIKARQEAGFSCPELKRMNVDVKC